MLNTGPGMVIMGAIVVLSAELAQLYLPHLEIPIPVLSPVRYIENAVYHKLSEY